MWPIHSLCLQYSEIEGRGEETEMDQINNSNQANNNGQTNNSSRTGYIRRNIRYLAEAAIIGAMYAALTILIPGSSGNVQVRVSEALTVLAFFTPAAIPGLFAGCIIANLVVGTGPYDIVFGSLATLAAAWLTSKMPSKYLASMPPVIVNAVVVAFVLNITIQAPLAATMGFVAMGELIACYGLGYPLLLLLERQKSRIFGSKSN